MHIYPFEKLDVWDLSIDLIESIYKMTSDLPTEEKYGIKSQLRRAVNSISANIAEGSARFSRKEKVRFYEIAYGSAVECLSFLMVCVRLEYLTAQELVSIRSRIEVITRKLGALVKSMRQ